MMRFLITAALWIFTTPVFAQDKPATLTCVDLNGYGIAQVSLELDQDRLTIYFYPIFDLSQHVTIQTNVIWIDRQNGNIWSETPVLNHKRVVAFQPEQKILKMFTYSMVEESGETNLETNVEHELKCDWKTPKLR